MFVSRNFPFESDSRTTCGACGVLLAELAVGGWLCGCIRSCRVQSRDGGTETRQGFETLAGRVSVSVVVVCVVVGTAES